MTTSIPYYGTYDQIREKQPIVYNMVHTKLKDWATLTKLKHSFSRSVSNEVIKSEYLLVQVYSDRKLLLHILTLYIEHDMLSS
jgi:hypothetical protein